jgi:hypothetical protein
MMMVLVLAEAFFIHAVDYIRTEGISLILISDGSSPNGYLAWNWL